MSLLVRVPFCSPQVSHRGEGVFGQELDRLLARFAELAQQFQDSEAAVLAGLGVGGLWGGTSRVGGGGEAGGESWGWGVGLYLELVQGERDPAVDAYSSSGPGSSQRWPRNGIETSRNKV